MTAAHGRSRSAPVELRPYQQGALTGIAEAFGRGDRSTLACLATGTGKTVIFAEQARREVSYGRAVLVIVHRDELLRQALAKLEAVGLPGQAEKGARRASHAACVVVASVQSLRGKRLHAWDPDHFGLIVMDEAHHAPAPGYRAITEWFRSARVLGVTATPDRSDGLALGDAFASCAYRYEIRDAIRDGWLVPITARRVVLDGVDLSAVKSRAGDLAQDQLAAIMAAEEAVRGVVVPLLELAGDRKTIVFGVDVAHAVRLAATLNTYRPGCARSVSGTTDELEREELLAAFARGEFQFLCNCALLTEGYDEPGVACIAMVRPTKSRGLLVQCVGRGSRLLGLSMAESIARGKRDCLYLDFTGQAGKHRLVGPVDVLAGSGVDVPDELRAELDRLLGVAQVDLAIAIDEAQTAIESRVRDLAAAAIVRYHTNEIDPFLGVDGDQAEIDPRWVFEPMTPTQEKSLRASGVAMGKLPAMSRADAERLIARLDRRWQRGLCTYKQAKQIARAGIDTRELSAIRAQALILKLVAANWHPAAIAGEPEAIAARNKRAADQIARMRHAMTEGAEA